MTLLVREIGRFVLEALAWIGFELVIAGAVGSVGALALGRDRARSIGVGFLGAITFAALAVRLDVPIAWAPTLGGRPLPVVWSIIGSAIAVGIINPLPQDAAVP